MLNRLQLERWLFGVGPGQRRTQDSQILPDVWYAYALPQRDLSEEPADVPLLAESQNADTVSGEAEEGSSREADLLLRPWSESSASDLARILAGRLDRPRAETLLVFNDAYVACRLTFVELLHAVLPLTEFWQRLWLGQTGPLVDVLGDRTGEVVRLLSAGQRMQGRQAVHADDIPGDLVWLIGLVGRITWEHQDGRWATDVLPSAEEIVDLGLGMLGLLELGAVAERAVVWSVSRNRPVQTAVWRSRVACKADAATALFKLSCRDVRWAVIDSGIDARHPAFARRNDGAAVITTGVDPLQSSVSRVAGTWDFATLREVLAARPLDGEPSGPPGQASLDDPAAERVLEAATRVARGRSVDWEAIAPLLAVPHDGGYRAPADDHGTHVAGILAGDWRSDDAPSAGEHAIQGMCPDMWIYDLRAFDADGASDEFQILSAMQFVRHLNAHSDIPVLHGVNLSFSVRHDVDKYAAGVTPVCEEAHRLVGSGVITVAAAGNDGRGGYMVQGRVVDGYRSVSITDPGNAEKVITVGATHRDHPHSYGVSYFSSRGPTGDGRAKPDLVAPGEKITSAVPEGGLRSKDGTSQATPHVSGACALLMARHPELIGQPERVKQILMASCTDLGRERSFQGAGIVDILRAIQSV